MRIKIMGKWKVNCHTGDGFIIELSREQVAQVGIAHRAADNREIIIRCPDNWLNQYIVCETSGSYLSDDLQFNLRERAFLRAWARLGYPLEIQKETYHYGNFTDDYPHGLVKFSSQGERDIWVALDPIKRAKIASSDKWIRRGNRHGWVCEMADRNGPAIF